MPPLRPARTRRGEARERVGDALETEHGPDPPSRRFDPCLDGFGIGVASEQRRQGGGRKPASGRATIMTRGGSRRNDSLVLLRVLRVAQLPALRTAPDHGTDEKAGERCLALQPSASAPGGTPSTAPPPLCIASPSRARSGRCDPSREPPTMRAAETASPGPARDAGRAARAAPGSGATPATWRGLPRAARRIDPPGARATIPRIV